MKYAGEYILMFLGFICVAASFIIAGKIPALNVLSFLLFFGGLTLISIAFVIGVRSG